MLDSDSLLEQILLDRQERDLRNLLELKGYAAQNQDGFGLNSWTRRLTPLGFSPSEELLEGAVPSPDHLVSFLIIPAIWRDDELVDTNSSELHSWLAEHKWETISGLQPPFPHTIVQACNEGVILPRWVHDSEKKLLEAFLLVRRDGTIEFGLGREAYSIYKSDTIFQLIQIVGRLWQLLDFVSAFYSRFVSDVNEILCIMNMRGTKGSLMGNLAEGWKQPTSNLSIDSYRPRCYERNIQIQKKIALDSVSSDVDEIVRWFATRVENGWGQFEPRCYVHQKRDESQPFARSVRR